MLSLVTHGTIYDAASSNKECYLALHTDTKLKQSLHVAISISDFNLFNVMKMICFIPLRDIWISALFFVQRPQF